MTEESPAIIIEKMLDLFEDGKKWGKLLYMDGRYCLLGALSKIMYNDIYTVMCMYSDRRTWPRELLLIEQEIEKQFPNCYLRITDFNDDPYITFNDIRSILEKVAVKLDESV